MRNRIIAGLLAVALLYSALTTRCYQGFADSITGILDAYFPKEEKTATDAKEAPELSVSEKVSASMRTISTNLLADLPYKNSMVELSGKTMKLSGTRSYYNNTYGLNITTDGYNVGRYLATSTDYEVQQMIEFKKYLDDKGIDLLYVSEPAKYIDDAYYTEQFGGESFLNRNTDLFLSRIGEAGIDYVDLRDNIRQEGIDSKSLFFRTDHHWTVPAAKWAAQITAQKLNDTFGYKIDMSLYDDSAFNVVEYKDCWLGEQGRKVAKSYIGLDDYTMMEPKYETSYKVLNSAGEVVNKGDFGIFINKDIYTADVDPYESPSWHYSYNDYAFSRIHNNNIKKGKVLVLGDSYERSMAPFLSLGLKDVEVIIPRNIPKGVSVRDYIESGEYDTVIIAYAQFMIGAHDVEGNANYKMFTLSQ